MPKTDRSRHRPRAAATALAVLGLVLVGGGLAPVVVRAHAALLDASPAPNSVIPASPPQLVLLFSEAVDPASIRLQVLDSAQQPVPGVGSPLAVAGGLVVSAVLPPLGPDTYTVDFAVVSAVDGHPNARIYAFVVDPTGLEPPPAIGGQTAAVAATDATAVAARWLATIAGLLLVGTVLVWLVHQRLMVGDPHQPAPWLVLVGLAAAALIGLSAHLVRAAAVAAETTGVPLGGTGLPFDPAAPFGWTPYGVAMRVALLGSAAALGVALTGWLMTRRARGEGAGSARSTSRTGLILIGSASAVLLFGLSLTGHAAALGGTVWAVVDAFHLLGIAAWLGALPALILLTRRLRAGGRLGAEARGLAFGSHARVAMIAAPIVILTGLANSPLVLADSRELAASEYGNLLLAKALLVSVALGLGAANFLIVRHRQARGMGWIVGLELAVAVIAVVAGTTMASIQPASGRPASSVDPRLGVAHLYGEVGQSRVHGIVDLPEPGVQSYTFAISDPTTGAAREDIAQVSVTFIPPPESGLPTNLERALPAAQPWIWALHGAYTPAVGNWELEVVIQHGGLEEDRVRLPLAVRPVLRPTPLPPPITGSQVLGTLAAPASVLPAGDVAWTVPVGLLALAASLRALERRRTRAHHRSWRFGRGIGALAVVAAVTVGTSLLARDAVATANQPPDIWLTTVNPLDGDPAAIAAGERLYRANCSSCHGPDGAGDGPATGDLAPWPGDLAEFVPDRLDGEVAWAIGAGVAGTRMPAFGDTLLEGERWELVTYLRSRWPHASE